jgi:hypothetical protein
VGKKKVLHKIAYMPAYISINLKVHIRDLPIRTIFQTI